MIDPTTKKQILEKILTSPELNDSKKNQTLLRYLAEHSIQGQSIKEITIAIDQFGKDAHFDSAADPIVRVSIGNLRKKLDHYYLTSGKDDKIRLAIPKGHYEVQFQAFDPGSIKRVKLLSMPYVLFLPILFLLLIVIIYLLRDNHTLHQKDMNLPANHPLWDDFIQSSSPTTIVLGDFFLLFEYKEEIKRGLFVRDPHINSDNEFRQLLKNNPNLIKQYVPADFTNLSPSCAIALAEVMPILTSRRMAVDLKLASSLKWEELKGHNIIYIGMLKTLYLFNELLPTLGFRHQLNPPELYFIDRATDSTSTFAVTWAQRREYFRDYAVIAKYQGQDKNMIMLITAFDEMGVIEAARKVADPQFLSLLQKKYLPQIANPPMNFRLVLEVEGINRTVFKSSVKICQEFRAE